MGSPQAEAGAATLDEDDSIGGNETVVVRPGRGRVAAGGGGAPADDEILRFAADESRCGFIPGYSIVGRLGHGGMSVVYQAIQEKLQRVVALKVLNTGRTLDEEAVARFEREARAVARLNHPNIVTAYDYGEADGQFFLALEYIEGMDCAQLVDREGRLERDLALLIVRDAILGLSHALGQGIIHRDVKPANLMFVDHAPADARGGSAEGFVKVTDLGLARVQDAARGDDDCIVGTPCYMAPEQACGEEVDFRADIYALGATLYRMVTGAKPFDAPSANEAIRRKREERLVHPADLVSDVDVGVVRLMDRMLARTRDQRYPSYESLLEDVERLLGGRSPLAAPVPPAFSSFEPPRLRCDLPDAFRALAEAAVRDDRTGVVQVQDEAGRSVGLTRRLLEPALAFLGGLLAGLVLFG